MAERRMFAKTIIMSDAFLDLPATARCLYFTLAMVADDDGFVNNPKSIMRQSGATNDDMTILLQRKFLILFEDGVVVIKHWRIHNYIRMDRYVPTKYEEDKALLSYDENKAYRRSDTVGIPVVDQLDTQVRIGKDRLGKKRGGGFTPPSSDDVKSYCVEKGYNINAEKFVDYYSQQGWKLSNGNRMVDWQAAVRNWVSRDKARNRTGSLERDYGQNELRAMVNDPLRNFKEEFNE